MPLVPAPSIDWGDIFLAIQRAVGTSRYQPLLPAALTGQIYLDPQNVTGVATDIAPQTIIPTNETVPGPVFKTFRGITNVWGSTSPVLNAFTRIKALSSHTDNSDPIIFSPVIGAPTYVSMEGQISASQVFSTGTITVNAAKSRAGAQLLDVNLPSGVAGARVPVGTLVVNATQNANALVFSQGSAGHYLMSQSMSPTSGSFPAVSEKDTWTTGDTVTCYSLINLNIVRVAPIATVWDPTLATLPVVVLTHLNIFDPTTQSPLVNVCDIGSFVRLFEGTSNRFARFIDAAYPLTLSGNMPSAYNFGFTNAASSGEFGQNVGHTQSGPLFFGGFVANFKNVGNSGLAGTFDMDFIVSPPPSPGSQVANVLGSIASMYIDTGTLCVVGHAQAYNGTGGAGRQVWGPGNFNVSREGRMVIDTTATGYFLNTGTISINGQTTALALDMSVDPNVWHGPRNLTVANLDALVSSGGFVTNQGGGTSPGGIIAWGPYGGLITGQGSGNQFTQ